MRWSARPAAPAPASPLGAAMRSSHRGRLDRSWTPLTTSGSIRPSTATACSAPCSTPCGFVAPCCFGRGRPLGRRRDGRAPRHVGATGGRPAAGARRHVSRGRGHRGPHAAADDRGPRDGAIDGVARSPSAHSRRRPYVGSTARRRCHRAARPHRWQSVFRHRGARRTRRQGPDHGATRRARPGLPPGVGRPQGARRRSPSCPAEPSGGSSTRCASRRQTRFRNASTEACSSPPTIRTRSATNWLAWRSRVSSAKPIGAGCTPEHLPRCRRGTAPIRPVSLTTPRPPAMMLRWPTPLATPPSSLPRGRRTARRCGTATARFRSATSSRPPRSPSWPSDWDRRWSQ